MDHFDLSLVKNLPRNSLANPYYAETGFRHIQMAFETSFARHQGKGVLCSMDKPRSWEKYMCARMIFLACSSVLDTYLIGKFHQHLVVYKGNIPNYVVWVFGIH